MANMKFVDGFAVCISLAKSTFSVSIGNRVVVCGGRELCVYKEKLSEKTEKRDENISFDVISQKSKSNYNLHPRRISENRKAV